MPNVLNGVIPINSGDDSVLLECDQKSQASIAAAGGVLQTGATVSGAGVTVGNAGGVQYDLTALSAEIKSQLKYTGQISFTVNRFGIATSAAEYAESVGYTGSLYFMHWNATDNVALPYGRIWSQGSTDSIVCQVSGDTDTKVTNQSIHEAIGLVDSDRNIKVTLSFNGSSTKLIANGFLIYETTRNIYTSGLFEYLMTGALLPSSSPVVGAIMSDIIVASRPVQYAAHEMLPNVVWYGDSYVDQQGELVMYNAGCIKTFDAYFRRIGLACDGIEAGVSGALVLNSAANTVNDQLNGVGTKPNLGLQDLSPRLVCFRDFVNDVIVTATSLTQSIADRKTQIQTVLDRNSKNHVIIGTVPSQANNPAYDNATIVSRIDTINGLINSLPADMTTISAAYDGRVHIVDQFNLFGGHTPVVKLYKTGNNHPNGFGQFEQGMLYAKKAAELI